jgi:hypothetical protein
MNVEIGAEAALFPEKEYISGIFVAVWSVCAGRSGSPGPVRVSTRIRKAVRKFSADDSMVKYERYAGFIFLKLHRHTTKCT